MILIYYNTFIKIYYLDFLPNVTFMIFNNDCNIFDKFVFDKFTFLNIFFLFPNYIKLLLKCVSYMDGQKFVKNLY